MPHDVVCLSHLRWGFVYQRPNHLMGRCARDARVFFVEEPLFDAAIPYLATQTTPERLTVVVPHVPSAVRSTPEVDAVVRRLLDRLVDEARIRDPLLWFYTPMALQVAGHLRSSAVVYDCMDELASFHGAPPELRERERELFRRADLVFTGGLSLFEAKRHLHDAIHPFPSSVDAAHFGRVRTETLDAPEDQRDIRRPRLGYFGVIDERIDLPLLGRLADAHADWSIVMLGPLAKIAPSALPRRPNLHYLGHKTYAELPAYLAGWDVALMPFARNEATRFISPTKTLEYLAAGKPVVSTPIHDVVHPYGERGFVRIGEGAGFVGAVEAAIAERGTAAAALRRSEADALLSHTSWDRTWGRMRALIAEVERAGLERLGAGRCSTI